MMTTFVVTKWPLRVTWTSSGRRTLTKKASSSWKLPRSTWRHSITTLCWKAARNQCTWFQTTSSGWTSQSTSLAERPSLSLRTLQSASHQSRCFCARLCLTCPGPRRLRCTSSRLMNPGESRLWRAPRLSSSKRRLKRLKWISSRTS